MNLTAYWVSLDSGFTIGSTASGANLAKAWAQQLFTHLWNNDSALALLTSAGGISTRGASAVADWSANKRLTLPDARGRTLIGIGQGSGLTNRALGGSGGSEAQSLLANNLPVGTLGAGTGFQSETGGLLAGLLFPGTGRASNAGQAHNNMQPYLAVQNMIFGGFA